MPSTTTGFGISAVNPPGWRATVYRRTASAGEATYPVLHATTGVLPATSATGGTVADFGAGIVENLTTEQVFVSLMEYGPDVVGTALFARSGLPRLAPSQFSPNRMPRILPGKSAGQHFFALRGRAFCLYVVLGSHARRMALVPAAEVFVRQIRVAPSPSTTPSTSTTTSTSPDPSKEPS